MKNLLKLIFSLLIIQLPCFSSEPQVKTGVEESANAQYDSALEHYKTEQYDLAIPKFMYTIDHINDEQSKAISRLLLGIIHFKKNNPKEAYRFLLPLTEQEFDLKLKLDAHNVICQSYKSDDSDAAKSIYNHHSMVAKFTENRLNKINSAKMNLAEELIKDRKYSEAKKLLLEIKQNNSDKDLQILINLALAEICMATKDYSYYAFSIAQDLVEAKEYSVSQKLLLEIKEHSLDLVLKASADSYLGMIYFCNQNYAYAQLYLIEAAQQTDCLESQKESCKLLAHMVINGHCKDFSLIRKIIMKFMRSLSSSELLFNEFKVLFKKILEVENKSRRAKKTFED